MQHILHDFMSNVLIHKPDDVFSFAQTYFAAITVPSTAKLVDKEKAMKESIRHFIVVAGAYFLCSSSDNEGSHELSQEMKAAFPSVLERALSYTTRKVRKNEVHGVHHYFVSPEEFSLRKNDMVAIDEVCYETYWKFT